MDNFIPPKNILGTIKVSPKHGLDECYIGEAHFAIEKIGDKVLLNIWASAFHYELHNGQEVLVGDVAFEIMQPIATNLESNEIIQIGFPNEVDEIESGWETVYFGHFYELEHLYVTNWTLKLSSTNETYKIEVKGFITDDIRKISGSHHFESTFETKMESKINSKFNWNYSSNNPNALNMNQNKKSGA